MSLPLSDLRDLNVGQILQPGQSLQRIRRHWADEFSDQHGRHFAANYDKDNTRPVEELRPVDHNPPWLPPQRYIQWAKPDGGFRFKWDYETMAADLMEAAQSYYAAVMDFMLEYMKDTPIPEIGEPVPAQVIRSPIGAPPLSPALPLAAQAGDPWLLGVPGAPVNTQLKAILDQTSGRVGRGSLGEVRQRMLALANAGPVPAVSQVPVEEETHRKGPRTINDVDVSALKNISYREYIGEAMKRGLSMAQAALSWQEHKREFEGAA